MKSILLRTLIVIGSILLASEPIQAGFIKGFQQTGNISMEMIGAATVNPPAGIPAIGSLTLNNVFPGTALRAIFYANTVNNFGAGMDLSLSGMSPIIPTVNPFAFDNSGNLTTMYAYRWDVSNIVNALGTGVYNFTVGANGNGNQMAGVAMAVIYQNFSAPTTQITLFEGIQSVAENGVAETESLLFQNILPGKTQVDIFTVMDDTAGTGEKIFYNGNLIGQNIDQNLGFNASLLSFNTTSLAGNNTLAIQSSNGPPPLGIDNFGWMLAGTTVIVPEPASWKLALTGLLCLTVVAVYRRTNRSYKVVGS